MPQFGCEENEMPYAMHPADTAGVREQLETAAGLGFVVASTAERRDRDTLRTIKQLLALLPLRNRTAQDALDLVGRGGSDASAQLEAKLDSELGPVVSRAFSGGLVSYVVWKAVQRRA
jgi:hypothetical protein